MNDRMFDRSPFVEKTPDQDRLKKQLRISVQAAGEALSALAQKILQVSKEGGGDKDQTTAALRVVKDEVTELLRAWREVGEAVKGTSHFDCIQAITGGAWTSVFNDGERNRRFASSSQPSVSADDDNEGDGANRMEDEGAPLPGLRHNNGQQTAATEVDSGQIVRGDTEPREGDGGFMV